MDTQHNPADSNSVGGTCVAAPHESTSSHVGLRICPPYWHANRVYAKGRWWNREILELLSTEFRDRSVEYYKYAIKTGATKVNGQIAPVGTIIRDGDILENMRHRHEPPITSIPVKIVHRDDENGFIVIDKPPSVPVHGVGRYYKHSLVYILKSEFGIEKPYTVNRLDRLTSGCMFIATRVDTARDLTNEITGGTMQKEYVARCRGKFPEDEITVDKPLISTDRQMGLNVVHPLGKPAVTIFKRLWYDENSDTSVLKCTPITGRTHQIRVHLQFIGYPIPNDPIYADPKVWGPDLGKGGIMSIMESWDLLAPSSETVPLIDEAAMEPLVLTDDPVGEGLSTPLGELLASPLVPKPPSLGNSQMPWALMQATNDGGTGSNQEGAIATDTAEDLPADMPSPSLYPSKGPRVRIVREPDVKPEKKLRPKQKGPKPRPPTKPAVAPPAPEVEPDETYLLPRETGDDIGMSSPVPLTPETVQIIARLRSRKDEKEQYARWKDTVFMGRELEALERDPESNRESRLASLKFTNEGHKHSEKTILVSGSADSATSSEDAFAYCEECFLPLWPNPKPSELYIYLHALRYSTSKWSYETDMPFWAQRGWVPDPEV